MDLSILIMIYKIFGYKETIKLNLFNIELESWNIIVIKLNWLAIIILLIALLVICLIFKKCMSIVNKCSVTISEVNLGIGNSSVKLSYSKKDQEIAYKLWVELSTRKIGLPFDQENDVINEVYDSWYEFFKIARELLKEIPSSRITYSSDLIQLTDKVLNMGLRPHLTIWQAKYRKWYDEALKEKNATPQEIQRKYPQYSMLIEDLLRTNARMIEYKKLIEEIAFEK